ncbi:MAG: FecR family protein [Mucilaginibacter sp.]
MQKKPSGEILEKYFKGLCNDNEIAEINSWYTSHGDADLALTEDEKEALRTSMLNSIRIKISDAEISYPENSGSGTRKLWYYVSTGIAAMLAIGILIGHKKQSPQPVKASNELVAINTTKSIEKITLSDGSKVWLSPNSRLTYLKSFAKESRKVALEGEAFFEVTKDHKRPFSIQSGIVTTKVWGTSFRIRAFRNDGAKVDVVTGKVSVSIPGAGSNPNENDKLEEVMLYPNQEATHDNGALHLKKSMEIKDQSMTIWRRESVSFDHEPMPRVFAVLNSKYNINLKSGDKEINSDFFTGNFTNESLPAIMEIMKRALNVSYVINGKDITLTTNQ